MRVLLATLFVANLGFTCPQINKQNVQCENINDGYGYVIDKMSIVGSLLTIEFSGFEIQTEFPFTESYNGLTTTNFCNDSNEIVSEESGHGFQARNVSTFYADRFETTGTTIYEICDTNNNCEYGVEDYEEVCRF